MLDGGALDKLKVALIDDHQLFREGLRALLGSQPDLKVVGEAADAREGYGLVESQRPDVVVLDVSLPGVDGIAATRELRRRVSASKVLILTMHAGEEYAAEALSAGAAGYALKTQPGHAVADAIRAVARGDLYLAPGLSRAAVDERRLHDGGGPLAPLSVREREVFALLVRGFSNQAVAGELCISA
ncbi:MAG: response regulator, partial [Polyangia bacterium]